MTNTVNKPNLDDSYRVNREIRAKEVRVVDVEGKQLGILKIEEALSVAQRVALDLVEIAPEAKPPVCKVLDYSKFKYSEKKKAKEVSRKNRESKVEIKEIWLRPVTEKHDLDVKIKHAAGFLEDGDKVKFTVKFKGREVTHADQGRDLLNQVLAAFPEAKVESPIKHYGRQMTMIIAPILKK